jgi:spore coat polysaccharide biosynthesis protein SpsF
MVPTFIITIEARMNSERLYGKVLRNLGSNYNSLKLIIERIKINKLNYKIIIVTSKKKTNNAIVKFAKNIGVLCYRGSEKNVLQRLYFAVKNLSQNSIIQLTGDNPLIDIDLIKFLIEYYKKNYPKIDFVTNNNLFNKTCSSPLGMKASIIKKDSLKKAYKLAKKRDAKEHPSLFFYREGKKKFKIKNLRMPDKWIIKSNPRLTIDTAEDLIFIKSIFKKLNYKINFKFNQIKKIMSKNPKLMNINKHIIQKTPKI